MKPKVLLKNITMWGKKHAPELLLGAGIATGAACTVVACKKTLKLKETVEPYKEKLEDIRQRGEEDAEYKVKEYRKDITKTYLQSAGQVAKLYSLPVALGGCSLACVLGGHHILKGRYAAMSAAYLGVNTAFNQYRGRVKNELGEDMDRHFRFGTEMKEITVDEVDPETGKTKKVKKKVETMDESVLNNRSIYATVFDAANPNWSPYPEYNKTFLTILQSQFTDRLRMDGYLYLNDVLDALGFEKTLEGQVMGWIYNPNDPTKACYVDFGIAHCEEQHNRALLNGFDPSIVLDFNVDSNVLNEWCHDPSRRGGNNER